MDKADASWRASRPKAPPGAGDPKRGLSAWSCHRPGCVPPAPKPPAAAALVPPPAAPMLTIKADPDAPPSAPPSALKTALKLNYPVTKEEESEPPSKSGPQPRDPSLRDEAYYKSWPVLFRPEHMRNPVKQKQKETQPTVPDPPPNIDPSLFDMELPSIAIPDTPPLEQEASDRTNLPTCDSALSVWPTKAQSVQEARQTPEYPKVSRKHKRPIKTASELRAVGRQFTRQKSGAKDKSVWRPPGSRMTTVPAIRIKEEPAF